jgi:hypothetical protein
MSTGIRINTRNNNDRPARRQQLFVRIEIVDKIEAVDLALALLDGIKIASAIRDRLLLLVAQKRNPPDLVLEHVIWPLNHKNPWREKTVQIDNKLRENLDLDYRRKKQVGVDKERHPRIRVGEIAIVPRPWR